MRPDIFWYSAPTQITLPFNIVGLVAFQLFTMHWCGACTLQQNEGPCSTGARTALCL